MAEKRRELDVWIVQGNTVYRKVPYTVVTDWIQEGRLLAEDKVRSAGTDKWHAITDVPALATFLPRAEPFRIDDRAEALEPVEAGFDWKQGRHDEEEGDVDMIPLIDVSLVLLIFFMMTAAVSAGLLSPIRTPAARKQLETIGKDMYWIGIDIKGPNGKRVEGKDGQPVPWYSLGKGTASLDVRPNQAEPEERVVTQDPAEVTAKLVQELGRVEGPARISLRADRTLMIEVIRAMTVQVQRMEAQINRGRAAGQKLKIDVLGEVSEPQSQ
jgi:biopolymer transport protein ExbD